jgi:hypothetical protein
VVALQAMPVGQSLALAQPQLPPLIDITQRLPWVEPLQPTQAPPV